MYYMYKYFYTMIQANPVNQSLIYQIKSISQINISYFFSATEPQLISKNNH